MIFVLKTFICILAYMAIGSICVSTSKNTPMDRIEPMDTAVVCLWPIFLCSMLIGIARSVIHSIFRRK